MKPGTIRTSVDLPRPLLQKLHEAAARKGCSVHELILTAIEQAIEPARRKKGRVNLEHGLVPRTGEPISITNEEIYELGFP
jgi:metal-responsive CopG/Arc/MetJ family transcriptional regulator